MPVQPEKPPDATEFVSLLRCDTRALPVCPSGWIGVFSGELMSTAGMIEIRFEVDADETNVLEGYCKGTGKSKTAVMRRILKEWSEAKAYEATLVLRFAGGNGNEPEANRK